jgi:hypothetical protein
MKQCLQIDTGSVTSELPLNPCFTSEAHVHVQWRTSFWLVSCHVQLFLTLTDRVRVMGGWRGSHRSRVVWWNILRCFSRFTNRQRWSLWEPPMQSPARVSVNSGSYFKTSLHHPINLSTFQFPSTESGPSSLRPVRLINWCTAREMHPPRRT